MQSQIVIVGFGSIGQGVVPLLQRQFPGWRITAFDRRVGPDQIDIAHRSGITLQQCNFTQRNYRDVLIACVHAGDILLNLATDVSSRDLIRFAQSVRAIYLDTNIEPWESEQPADLPLSNHHLRSGVLALQSSSGGASTAIVAHGANPGFVSILVKRALLDMARKVGCETPADAATASLPVLRGDVPPFQTHVMKAEIDVGVDELGVLLISDRYPSYWLGSGLSIENARKRAPYNNATSLQVTSSIVAALAWAIRHPNAGIVESDALPHDVLYDATAPYWQPMYSAFTAWPHRGDDRAARRLTFDALRRLPIARGSSAMLTS